MTKSTITREESVQAVFDLKAGYRLGFADIEILKRVARMALAAMDCEPVAENIRIADAIEGLLWPNMAIGNKAVIQEAIEALRAYHAQPVSAIPEEMTSEQAYEIGDYHGDPVEVFARGANWMRQHILDSTLAAAAQSTGSEPAAVPGKWIPVSEQMPENDGAYLCWDNRYVTTYAFIFGAWQANQFVAKNITHWMPLPAAPQEVKP